MTGEVTDTQEIAKRAGCSDRQVRMTITLAFLSPAIVKGAVEGTLPSGVGIAALSEMPWDWGKQLTNFQSPAFEARIFRMPR